MTHRAWPKLSPSMATPTVQLAFLPTEVVLTVTNTAGAHNGTPGSLASTAGGNGIGRLREPAKLLGGTLTASPLGAGLPTVERNG